MQYLLIAVLAGFAAQFNFSLDNPVNWAAGAVSAFLGVVSAVIGIAKLVARR